MARRWIAVFLLLTDEQLAIPSDNVPNEGKDRFVEVLLSRDRAVGRWAGRAPYALYPPFLC